MNDSSLQPDRRFALERLLVARIASGVGTLAIIVAILATLVQRDITLVVLISTIIGVGSLGLWVLLAPDDVRTLVSGRQAIYGGNSILTSALVIGIIAIVYTLASNANITADLTAVGYYSLKHDTSRAVDALVKPIQITAFYNSAHLDDEELDMPILNMFRDAKPSMIKLNIVDPDQQPLVAKSFGLVGATGIYVSQLDANGQPDPQQTVKAAGTYAQESWIAQAILQLQAQGKYHVLFTVGNGEIATNKGPETPGGPVGDAWRIRDGLDSAGIVTGTLDLKNDDIPGGTTAIVMLGPSDDPPQAEVDKLAKYMADGGKLLIMAKPAYMGTITFMVPPTSPMAQYLWNTWGIRPQNDIVFDSKSFLQDKYRLLADHVAKNAIMNKDATGQTQIRPLLTIAESWQIADRPPASLVFTPLIFTSDQSVGKTDVRNVATNPDATSNTQLQQGDLPGPLIMAAAVQNSATTAKLLVIGDSEWAMNEPVQTFDGATMWTNMVDYLTSYLSNITVTAVSKQLPLIADTGSLNLVLVITLFVMPGIVLVTGAVVWWDRLRRL